jgi:hypothetical protein
MLSVIMPSVAKLSVITPKVVARKKELSGIKRNDLIQWKQ